MPIGEFISNRAWAMLALAAILSFAPLLLGAPARPAAVAAGAALPAAGRWRYASAIALFVLSCSALATSTFNPFIYFRF